MVFEILTLALPEMILPFFHSKINRPVDEKSWNIQDRGLLIVLVTDTDCIMTVRLI